MLAVPAPTVRPAGLEKAVDLVLAACDPAFFFAAAMFAAEAFTSRGGGAARHGARLPLLPAAVCDAVLEPLSCRGGASINLAPAIRTVPSAPAAGMSKSLAALNVAHFGAATAMPATQSSCYRIRFAIVKRAEAVGAMLRAEAVFNGTCIAPISRAKPFCPVRIAKPPCNNNIAAV